VAKTLKTAQTESNQNEIVVFCGFGLLGGRGLGAMNVVERVRRVLISGVGCGCL